MSLTALDDVVTEFRDLKWPMGAQDFIIQEVLMLILFIGAIELPLRCAAAWDPDGIGLEWRPPARSIHDQNASPTGTIATLKPEGQSGSSEHAVAMRQAWETRMRCYDIALGSLNSFNETQGVATDADYNAAFELREDAWNAVFSSTDAAFHSRLYDWCMERGLTDILLNVSISFVPASNTHKRHRFKLPSLRNISAKHLSHVNAFNCCGNITLKMDNIYEQPIFSSNLPRLQSK